MHHAPRRATAALPRWSHDRLCRRPPPSIAPSRRPHGTRKADLPGNDANGGRSGKLWAIWTRVSILVPSPMTGYRTIAPRSSGGCWRRCPPGPNDHATELRHLSRPSAPGMVAESILANPAARTDDDLIAQESELHALPRRRCGNAPDPTIGTYHCIRGDDRTAPDGDTGADHRSRFDDCTSSFELGVGRHMRRRRNPRFSPVIATGVTDGGNSRPAICAKAARGRSEKRTAMSGRISSCRPADKGERRGNHGDRAGLTLRFHEYQLFVAHLLRSPATPLISIWAHIWIGQLSAGPAQHFSRSEATRRFEKQRICHACLLFRAIGRPEDYSTPDQNRVDTPKLKF